MNRSDGHSIPVVLDTNAVLDWKLFAAPQATALRSALDAGHLVPLASRQTLAELRTVLERPMGSRWDTERERTLSDLDSLVKAFELRPDPIPVRHNLQCSDTSDQKFLDLALQSGVGWLVTRDKALLRLQRRARAFGLAIVKPDRWAALDSTVVAA